MLVERAILEREADKLGLTVSNEDLKHELQNGPLAQYLFPDGKFIGDDAYMNFVQQRISRMSVADFEAEVKADMELQRLQALITGGVTVSDTAVREEFMKAGHEGEVRLRGDLCCGHQEDDQPEDADLEAFFKQNAPRYATAVPETRKIAFFSFDASNLQAASRR